VTTIIGISCFYHDSAAALIVDGDVKFAAQEERFTRKKHDASFPLNAINFILSESGLKLSDIDHVAFYDKPFIKFERLLETYFSVVPKGFMSFMKALPVWLKEKLFLKTLLLKELSKIEGQFESSKLYFSEHHLSHAASAFFPSPYEEAIVLTVDGVGEWATTSVAVGKGNKLKILKEIHFPHSLGLLYSAFTFYAGFRVNTGEYKLMGLAPYGTPVYADTIKKHLIDIKDDGSFRLNHKYFSYTYGLKMINSSFERLFGHPARRPDVDEITQFHMDVAASIQHVTEEIMLRLTSNLRSEYGIKNLCLAGGVALNCVANGKLIDESGFENIWIQPAAGDAGGALGAALALWHLEFKRERVVNSADSMSGSYLGPIFSSNEIEQALIDVAAVYTKYTHEEMLEITADELSNGAAVGWMQHRMEFGPRSLGARSILGDPRSSKMQKILNLKVKYRESFRPFAPSVLFEHVSQWFDINVRSPYMLFV